MRSTALQTVPENGYPRLKRALTLLISSQGKNSLTSLSKDDPVLNSCEGIKVPEVPPSIITVTTTCLKWPQRNSAYQ
ncbi:hypothetical protein TNCV_1636641 [Trichonephila clavipes]|nr:hypothetical protein TNCV_1636641 [Trichonephila clavipes]